MGKPVGSGKVLTKAQELEIYRRHAKGESLRSLAKQYNVGPSTLVRMGLTESTAKVREVAQELMQAEQKFAALPVSLQVSARLLADELKAVSSHLVGAAKQGSMTAHRLSVIANEQVDRLDPAADLDDNAPVLRSIAAFTDTANKAASIGLNLLAANKKTLENAQDAIDVTPNTIPDDPVEAARIYQRMMGG